MVRKKKDKKETEEEVLQDEYFYFIAGYTSGGAPYGTTWEEAYADGLLEEEELEEMGKVDEENLPF